MTRTYDQLYQGKRENLSNRVAEGEVTESDAEAIRELCDAFDETKPTTEMPVWPDAPNHLTKPRELSTLANWMYYLTQYARRIELLDTTTEELNQVAEDWLNGDDPYKDSSLAKGSIRAYQNTARIFYRYHDVEGVDHERIQVFERQDTSIDPKDMLSPEEIDAARDAPDHPRDAAIIDLLLFTGLRNTALRTLKIKHLRPDDGEFYFNTEADGLKNIHKENAPRPLLGAVASVREWLKYHPESDDPEAYFITGKPKFGDPDPYEPVTHRTIQRVMDDIKEEAGIDKPFHPHAARHAAVTLWKRDYGMDDATVKFLIGHAPDSKMMETTYAHLSAEDHIQAAEEAAGIRDEDDESPYTREYCDVCGEPLPSDAKACSRCGTVYAPDARQTQEMIDEAIHESAKDATTEEEKAEVDELKRVVEENPQAVADALDAETLREALDGES